MKKLLFFASFFRNISKTAETIFLKNKFERNYGVLLYKKAIITEHRKNEILLLIDINDFVKTNLLTSTLLNFLYALAHKLV